MTPAAEIPPVGAGRSAPRMRRCVRHEEREAVGRCTVCQGGFCRECIAEHDGRLYCGPCFARESGAKAKAARKPRDWRSLRRTLAMATSLCWLLLLFYLMGRMLSSIPVELHDGTVWKEITEP